MYEIVLWATDASPVSDGALVEAVRLLQPGGRLIAYHCEERFLGGRAVGVPVLADETARRAKLLAQVEDLKADGLDAELVVGTTHHNAAGDIAKAAETSGADVIVCGTRGFGVVAGAVAGSVAMRLPHLASCPVIVVSEQAAARAELATRLTRGAPQGQGSY
ncbi:MAG TPA: universal stress protein [Gaiellaceae bacterium]|jgi:nucleotide-binding universal stress UspA family protein|nr:universal stress protein [Gaiellaceae bacterium]